MDKNENRVNNKMYKIYLFFIIKNILFLMIKKIVKRQKHNFTNFKGYEPIEKNDIEKIYTNNNNSIKLILNFFIFYLIIMINYSK